MNIFCMCGRLCAKFHAAAKMQNQNFLILAKIGFSARTTNKIRLKKFSVIHMFYRKTQASGHPVALKYGCPILMYGNFRGLLIIASPAME